MATASCATLSQAAITSFSSSGLRKRKSTMNVHYIRGLNAYDGLMAHNKVTSLGLPISADQFFAKLVNSITPQGRGRGGGVRCNAVAEIFKIAAIMNGLVLVGVAVGFVLLRIEAFVEEAEEA